MLTYNFKFSTYEEYKAYRKDWYQRYQTQVDFIRTVKREIKQIQSELNKNPNDWFECSMKLIHSPDENIRNLNKQLAEELIKLYRQNSSAYNKLRNSKSHTKALLDELHSAKSRSYKQKLEREATL
jgi:GTPase SAR1 family protein